ncbi:MAG: hypothetical protein IJO96_00055 [Oscillospiraceae bacterium]|nr:hypothetical protein [Oscillospiraceae bacterium]
MKKVLAIILVFAMCLSLCACGVDKTAVDHELQGKWTIASGIGVYVFNDGRFSCTTIVDTRSGSYEISGRKIKLNYDNGVNSKLSYSFNDGVLSIENLTKKG